MFSEISTPETRGQIFAFFSLMASASGSVAPLAGGLLARPADRFELFRRLPIFVSYPYLLPSLFAGSLAAGASILSALFLKETRTFNPEQAEDIPSTVDLLRSPGLPTVLVFNTWASLIGFAWITSWCTTTSMRPVTWADGRCDTQSPRYSGTRA